MRSTADMDIVFVVGMGNGKVTLSLETEEKGWGRKERSKGAGNGDTYFLPFLDVMVCCHGFNSDGKFASHQVEKRIHKECC